MILIKLKSIETMSLKKERKKEESEIKASYQIKKGKILK